MRIPREQYLPVTPGIFSEIGERAESQSERAVAQFEVESNPRYARTPKDTWCNVFVRDVALAFRVLLPQWVLPDGTPVSWDDPRGPDETTANDLQDWIATKPGRSAGWVECGRKEAQEAANDGLAVVALWKNPAGRGHAAWVRPGEWRLDGPWMAQAGARNYERALMRECFGMHSPRFFKHA